MYETTQNLTPAGRTTRRTWLAVGTGLAAVLVLLILVTAACQARGDDPVAGAAGTPAPSATDPTADPADTDQAGEPASGVGEGGENPGGGSQGGNQGGNSGGGGNPGPDDGSDDSDDSEDPGDNEEPAGPLSIDVAITAVAPNGHCSASGSITVDGGEYPLTVDFQWRRLVIGEGFDGVPVSPAQSHTFDEPGGISVQTNELPEDGTNVFLAVTSPKSAGSGLVTYDGCSGQAGGGTIGG